MFVFSSMLEYVCLQVYLYTDFYLLLPYVLMPPAELSYLDLNSGNASRSKVLNRPYPVGENGLTYNSRLYLRSVKTKVA